MYPKIDGFSCAHFRVPALLLMGVALSSQTSSPKAWQQVLVSVDDGVDIRGVWERSDLGWVFLVRNFGTTCVHLSHYMDTQQQASSVHEHGRLHLLPEGEARFPFQTPNGSFVLSEIRIGETDEGDFWRE